MEQASAWLELVSGERIFLTATCSIGRTPDNRVIIRSDAVSRRHATLRRNESGEWSLIDMGSSNGTYLNGQAVVQPVTLRDGHVIEIGPQKMTFRAETEVEPASEPRDGESVECWLLSFAATLVGARAPAEEADAKTFEHWSVRARRIVRTSRGVSLRAQEDSFLAFWPVPSASDRGSTVASALRSLRTVQRDSEEFRFALHFGPAVLRSGETEELRVQGPAVIHTMQLDRLARAFGCAVLITESAHVALETHLPMRPLSPGEMRGYRGTMQFFTIGG